jgi:mannose/fructose/N-acetylgalactosamine-specific phosphotransferase system component IID
MKKRVYVDLLQVLRLLNVSKIDKLFNRLFTLQSCFKRQLFFSIIHFVKISIQFNKQFTNRTKSIERKIHFFNAQVMINMILCFNIQMNFHIDMIDIVDNSHEF